MVPVDLSTAPVIPSPEKHEMSDVGSLSYEYERANDLAEKLEATLEETHGKQADRQARAELRPLLLALVDLLDPLSPRGADSPDVMKVPVGLVRRLRTRRFEGQAMSEALGQLAAVISSRGRELSERDLRLLREVNDETAREVSTVFRRMVRR
jgi:hypothetical protein